MSRTHIATLIFATGTVLYAILAGGGLFESLIVMPRWQEPGGVEAWRAVFGTRHAGYFFLPLNVGVLLCLAAGTALGWDVAPDRKPYALTATLIFLAGAIFTQVYFMPRNYLLFFPGTALHDQGQLVKLAKEWAAAQYLRVPLLLVGLVSAVIGLRKN